MFLWLLVALCVDRVCLKMTGPHYKSEFSAGYGSIDPVWRKTSKAPIAYRVLVPWLVRGAERLIPALKPMRLTALYEPIRIIALALALAASEYALGRPAALLVAALLAATFLFDFADWPFELLSFALALSGNMTLCILAVFLHGLARPETAPLAVITYSLVTGDLVGSALAAFSAFLAIVLARGIVGKKPLVMPLGTSFRLNAQDLRDLFKNRPFYLSETFISLTLIGVTVAVVLAGRAGQAWPVPMAICGAQVFWQARIGETRSLTPALLWIAAGIA